MLVDAVAEGGEEDLLAVGLESVGLATIGDERARAFVFSSAEARRASLSPSVQSHHDGAS